MTQDASAPPPDEGDEQQASAYAGEFDFDGEGPSGPRRLRPQIKISVDLGSMLQRACVTLRLHRKIFQRSHSLVRITRSGNESGTIVKRAIGSPKITEIPKPLLTIALQDVAEWIRFDGRSKEWVGAAPPSIIVDAVSELQVWEGVRPLIGISEWPFMRPDGSIVQGRPTYDQETGFIFDPSTEFPPVPASPTQDEINAARDLLLEVVCDFPFAAECYRSAWLAMLLTVLARPAISGAVPMFPIDASLKGTGKSRLADVTSLIVTGRTASKLPQPQDNEEMRKALTSIILEGEPFCCFDNIDPTIIFSYASLDQAITETDWKDRLLGTNRIARSPNNTVFCATGNNLQYGSDAIRRALQIRLESPLENPHRRSDFKHADLCTWVLSERPRLLVAALTILRGWVVAGRPHMGCTEPWGSFEQWYAMVPPAIVFAGLPDPMLAREELEERGDPKRDALRIILRDWLRLSDGQGASFGVSVKTAIAQLYTDRDPDGPPDGFDDLRDAIEELVPLRAPSLPPDAKRLGQQMRAHSRRVIGGCRLESRTSHGSTLLWYVRVMK